MKKEYVALALIVVGFLVYTRLSRPVSDEERQVQAYEERFETARNRFLASVRSLAMPGESAIADPDAAVRRLKAVKADFDRFYGSLTEDAALARADKLAAAIEEFFEKNDIE
ncbi:MAG: hypothetical protein JW742_05850 [Candidatus Aminicenantes bacterium]|nr:hypothetical protein [Candidatus Aminicenantes bacterium]